MDEKKIETLTEIDVDNDQDNVIDSIEIVLNTGLINAPHISNLKLEKIVDSIIEKNLSNKIKRRIMFQALKLEKYKDLYARKQLKVKKFKGLWPPTTTTNNKYAQLSEKTFKQYAPTNLIINTVYVGFGGKILYFGYMTIDDSFKIPKLSMVDGFSGFVKIILVVTKLQYLTDTFMHKAGYINTLYGGFKKISSFKFYDKLLVKSHLVINKRMFFNPKYLIAYVIFYIHNHISDKEKRIRDIRTYHQDLFMKNPDTIPTLQKTEIDAKRLLTIVLQSYQLIKDALQTHKNLQLLIKTEINK